MGDATVEDEEVRSAVTRSPSVAVSIGLLATTQLPAHVRSQGTDAVASALFKLQKVRLNKLSIRCIDNLDCLGCVTHLYLNHNHIKDMSAVDVLPSLQFLTLADNQIEHVPNLRLLRHLKLLDLSYNPIAKLGQVLPDGLTFLTIENTPFAQEPDHR